MELEGLSTEFEKEEIKVAMAFRVEDWCHFGEGVQRHCIGKRGQRQIEWQVSDRTLALTYIAIGQKGRRRTLVYFYPNFRMRSGANDELMASGLYCLGFDDEAVSNQLPLLSMHEKLELRLSMPREFWPQKWLDEEGE